MAYGYRCVRCGHPEERHDPNLVNENLDHPDFAWVEPRKKSRRMNILTCTETNWSKKYKRLAVRLDWRTDWFGHGYVSPNLEREARRREKEESRPLYLPTTIYIFYVPGRGSFVATGE